MILLLAACATEAPLDTAPPVDCPPDGPFGREAGAPAEDVAFADCAGAPASLRGLCGRPALLTAWYGWCPSCQGNAELSWALGEAHPGLAVVTVLVEDPLGETPDGALCGAYTDTYPSAGAVWTNPDGGLAAYGATDLVLVLDREGTLVFVEETSNESVITAAVEQVAR